MSAGSVPSKAETRSDGGHFPWLRIRKLPALWKLEEKQQKFPTANTAQKTSSNTLQEF